MQKEQLSSESNRISEGIDSVTLRNMSQQRADGHINRHTSPLPPSLSFLPVVNRWQHAPAPSNKTSYICPPPIDLLWCEGLHACRG